MVERVKTRKKLNFVAFFFKLCGAVGIKSQALTIDVTGFTDAIRGSINGF